MRLKYHKRFLKHYKKRIKPFSSIDRQFQARLALFLSNPKHPLLRNHQLAGSSGMYRSFSVSGDIRVVYKMEKDTVYLYDIGTHNQVY